MTPPEELESLFKYLDEDNQESAEAAAAAVINAADSMDYSVDRILQQYADSHARGAAIYPQTADWISDLIRRIDKKLVTQIGEPKEVIPQYRLVTDRDQVLNEAVAVGTDNSLPSTQKRQRIKELVQEAQNEGIHVQIDEVMKHIRMGGSSEKNTGQAEETQTRSESDSYTDNDHKKPTAESDATTNSTTKPAGQAANEPSQSSPSTSQPENQSVATDGNVRSQSERRSTEPSVSADTSADNRNNSHPKNRNDNSSPSPGEPGQPRKTDTQASQTHTPPSTNRPTNQSNYNSQNQPTPGDNDRFSTEPTRGKEQAGTPRHDRIKTEQTPFNIVAPQSVFCGEALTISTQTEDNITIKQVHWYLEGEHFAEGEDVSHTITQPGSVEIAAECETVSGRQFVESTTVLSKQVTEDILEIGTPEQVTVGQTVTFEALVDNVPVDADTPKWYINGEKVGSGGAMKFTPEASEALNIRVQWDSSNTGVVTAKTTVYAEREPNVSVDISVPDKSYVGEELAVEATAESARSSISSLTATIDGSQTLTKSDTHSLSFTEVFNVPGDYTIKVSARDEEGTTGTQSKTITVAATAELSITTDDLTCYYGDAIDIETESPPAITPQWETEEGSFTKTGADSATLKTPATAENNGNTATEIVVTVRATNTHGEVASDSITITVKEPKYIDCIEAETLTGDVTSLDPQNDPIPPITVDRHEPLSLSAIEHTDPPSSFCCQWQISDGEVKEGKYLNTAIADRGVSEIKVEVQGEYHTKTHTIPVEVSRTTAFTPNIDINDPIDTETLATATAAVTYADGYNEQLLDVIEYRWDIDDNPTRFAQKTTVSFDDPGEKELTLTVKTDAGTTQTQTTTITVNQVRPVRAQIIGPDESSVSDSAALSVNATANTGIEIDRIQWLINGDPQSSGKGMLARFSNPGTHLISLFVETKAGEYDYTTKQITVSDSAEMAPSISAPDEVEVNQSFSPNISQPATDEEETVNCKWGINTGTGTITETENTTEVVFTEPGPASLNCEITTKDGTSTITYGLQVRPTIDNPGYPPVDTLDTSAAIAEVSEINTSSTHFIEDRDLMLSAILTELKLSDIHEGDTTLLALIKNTEMTKEEIQERMNDTSETVRETLQKRLRSPND